MPTNKSRTLLRSVLTEDKTIEFKYYDTGLLVARYVDTPARSTGADDAFARVNNLLDDEAVALIPELFKLIEEVADRRMKVVIEYNDHMYLDLLTHLLNEKTASPLLRWTAFCAGVTDTRGFAPQEIMTLARECEPKLDETVATNSYRFFFRPDLGYFSQKDRSKMNFIADLRARQDAITASMEKPVFKLALERRESGVLTANHIKLQNPSPQYSGYSNNLYGASMFLTVEELASFDKLILKNKITDYQFDEESSMVLSYAYLTLGVQRTEELLHFFTKYAGERAYWYQRISFETMAHPQGALGYEGFVAIIDSLKGDEDV
jgi:hypothetical protein